MRSEDKNNQTPIDDKELDQGLRLHKSSPIFILFENIKRLIFPALIALFSTRGSYWEQIALAIATLVSIGSIVQYRYYRYWLEEKQIRIKEGIFFRNIRRVPYSKIQNLNLVQNPLHRIFGVVKVQLESASGSTPEAIINVIDMQAVKALRAVIQDEKSDAVDAEISNSDSDPQADVSLKNRLLKLGFKDVVRFGLISNRGLFLVAVAFGFLSQFLDDEREGMIKQTIETAMDYSEQTISTFVGSHSLVSSILMGVLFVLSALICLWVLSIIMAWLKFNDFELQKNHQKLSATTGALTRMQATIPMHRIQSLTVHNSWLHQKFRHIGITVETAGGVNVDSQGLTMKYLAPVLPFDLKQIFLQSVQPEISWQQVEWMPIEARAWKRVFKVLFVLATLLVIFPIVSVSYYFIVLWLLLVVLSFAYSRAYVRTAGYFLNSEAVAFKAGVIFQKEIYVRLSKIQTVKVKESLFDRRHRMATVEVDTAGATVGAHHVEIPYIELQDAMDLQQKLTQKVQHSQFQW